MFTTIMKVLVKCTNQTCGIMTIVSILHFIIVEHLSIPAWILSNVWGCACIFVFMDGVVLANDLKIMENKYRALELKYEMTEMFYKTEKQEFREREKAYLLKENILLGNLTNQNIDIKANIGSLQKHMLSMHEANNIKKRRRLGMMHSSSEIIRSSKKKENDPNIATRSPSVPDLCGL